MLSFCQSHYIYPLEILQSGHGDGEDKRLHAKSKRISVKSNQYAFVYYHKLQKDLTETIKSLFDQLEIPCESDYIKNVLSIEEKKCRNFRGTHQHSVEKCCGGISEQELIDTLKVVYEKHSDLMHE